MDETFLKTLPSVAVVAAALIAAGMAGVNLLLTKELKTSEFRKAWIDALRVDMATFCASARLFARSHEAAVFHAAGIGPQPYSAEKIASVRYEAALNLFKIQLSLSPTNLSHVQLIVLMTEALDAQNQLLAKQPDVKTVQAQIDKVMKAIGEVANEAQLVLHSDWEVVKRGGTSYRYALAGLVALFMVGILALFLMLRPSADSLLNTKAVVPCDTGNLSNMDRQCVIVPNTILSTPSPARTASSSPAGK